MTTSAGSAPSAFDLVVIGAGPGGYVAAIRAAQLGLRVACVEREGLGGICLNWGCIPTKALLRSAEVLELIHRANEFGITVTGVSHDLGAIVQRSRDIADKISKGVAFLFKKNKIEHVVGTAVLGARSGGSHSVTVALAAGGTRTLSAADVIIATGARARSVPGVTIDRDRILDYRGALALRQQPKTLVVLGAGAIGVEFASFYRALGVDVTLVEFMPRLVPNEDPEISTELKKAFERRGMKLRLGWKVISATATADAVRVAITNNDGGAEEVLVCDRLLVAIGTEANSSGLGLEPHQVALTRGFIQVDDHCRAAPGLWAIGDVTGRGLAHTASAEGVYVAETIAAARGQFAHVVNPVRYDAIPACTYCHPEIASVGLSEEKAKAQGVPVRVGRFPFKPLGKTMAAGEYPGFAKVLWHQDTGALVGAHLIGPAVTDLIAEMTLAKTTEVNAESLAYTIHAHPTFAEALKEATEDALGHAIHV